jgi:hypothetical protein
LPCCTYALMRLIFYYRRPSGRRGGWTSIRGAVAGGQTTSRGRYTAERLADLRAVLRGGRLGAAEGSSASKILSVAS